MPPEIEIDDPARLARGGGLHGSAELQRTVDDSVLDVGIVGWPRRVTQRKIDEHRPGRVGGSGDGSG